MVIFFHLFTFTAILYPTPPFLYTGALLQKTYRCPYCARVMSVLLAFPAVQSYLYDGISRPFLCSIWDWDIIAGCPSTHACTDMCNVYCRPCQRAMLWVPETQFKWPQTRRELLPGIPGNLDVGHLGSPDPRALLPFLWVSPCPFPPCDWIYSWEALSDQNPRGHREDFSIFQAEGPIPDDQDQGPGLTAFLGAQGGSGEGLRPRTGS